MSAKNYKAELVGVFGYPVSENPTVVMMEAAFLALNLNWRYLTLEVKSEDLSLAMKAVPALGMRGINLTIPHKIEVLKYLDEIAPDAQLIGAVNTVVVRDGTLIGENTDGKGFLASLTKEGGVRLEGANVVVLGAGGASRAICFELALHGARKITIVNRSEERGASLARAIGSKTGCEAVYIQWKGPYSIPDDTRVVVNATSIGLYPGVDDKPAIEYDSIRSDMVVCDVIPNPPRTFFLHEAEKRGAVTLDGLGMLVNQGVIGFKLWTGLEAPADIMRAALSREFSV
jgi:shikimate dehydrogenase